MSCSGKGFACISCFTSDSTVHNMTVTTVKATVVAIAEYDWVPCQGTPGQRYLGVE